MADDLLTEQHRDALQEIANIGMGSAGAKLAVLLDRFIELSVPRVCLVERDQLKAQVEFVLGQSRQFTAFRQSFRSDIGGEAMTFFDVDGVAELGAALHGWTAAREGEAAEARDEWLFEIANLLAGACLSGILEQFDRMPSFSVPRALGARLCAADVVDLPRLDLGRALLLDINMRIEHSGFRAYLLILIAERSVERLRVALDEFLATL